MSKSGHVLDAVKALDGGEEKSAEEAARWFIQEALAYKPKEILNHLRASKYEPAMGFSIAVDGLVNVSKLGKDHSSLYKVRIFVDS